jgi:hypothetical protein
MTHVRASRWRCPGCLRWRVDTRVQGATAEGAILLSALLVVANAWLVAREEDLSG